MILLDRVTKVYGKGSKPALDRVNLHVEPNEFVIIVGTSGAGKSTLLKLLTREEKPTSGKIVVGGIDYDQLKDKHIPLLRRKIGVVFQDFKLLPNRTVFENVAFALEIAGMTNREIKNTVPKVIDRHRRYLEPPLLRCRKHLEVECQTRRKRHIAATQTYSLGMKQRLGIAMTLAREPELLILDEPTNGLDPAGIEEIRRLLVELAGRGVTVMVSSHLLDEIDRMAGVLGVLSAGRLVFQGTRAQLMERSVPDLLVVTPAGRAALSAEVLAGLVPASGPGAAVFSRSPPPGDDRLKSHG